MLRKSESQSWSSVCVCVRAYRIPVEHTPTKNCPANLAALAFKANEHVEIDSSKHLLQ